MKQITTYNAFTGRIISDYRFPEDFYLPDYSDRPSFMGVDRFGGAILLYKDMRDLPLLYTVDPAF